MARTKVNPLLILVPGLLLIGFAVVMQLGSSGGSSKSPKKPKSKAALERERAALAEAEAEAAAVAEVEAAAEAAAAAEAEMMEILLAQIHNSPKNIDLPWLGEFCQFITNEASLRRFFESELAEGSGRHTSYLASMKRRKVVPSTSPQYFIEEAKRVIYSKKSSAATLKKKCPGLFAQAYYLEHEQKGGWENADAGFMSAYFNTYQIYQQTLRDSVHLSRKGIDRWRAEMVRVYEVALMDRYFRILHHRERARNRLKETGSSGAREGMIASRLQQFTNATLLSLGRLYLEAAANETSDITKLRLYAKHTFQAMAMVYQRKPSPEALAAVRQINEVQRSYLYRMALVSWQKARAAAEAGNRVEAEDHYFMANKRFLQCMSRLNEFEKQDRAQEYRKLKQEIASWRTSQQAPNESS